MLLFDAKLFPDAESLLWMSWCRHVIGCASLQEDVFSREPSVPQLPSKVHYSVPSAPAYASRVPQLDVSSLNSVERSRLQADQKQAQDLDQQLYQVSALDALACETSQHCLTMQNPSSICLYI